MPKNKGIYRIFRTKQEMDFHDEEIRHFTRVFQLDHVTIALGRMGFREPKFREFDKVLSEVFEEYMNDYKDDLKSDKEMVYSKAILDREIKMYVGGCSYPTKNDTNDGGQNMRPVLFHEANKMLTKPENVSKEVCGDLYVFTNGSECVSKWKLSFIERLRVLLLGTIWLCVLSGDSQPAVWMEARRTVFVKGPPPVDKDLPEVVGEVVSKREDV